MKGQLTTLMVAVALAAATAVPAAAQQNEDPGMSSKHAQSERQGRHGPDRRRGGMDRSNRNPEHMVKRLQRQLDLTDLQQQSISNVLLASKPEAEALRDASRANRKALRDLDTGADDYESRLQALADERGRLEAEQVALRGRVRAGIDEQLTDAQREKLTAMAQKQQERRAGRHADRNKKSP